MESAHQETIMKAPLDLTSIVPDSGGNNLSLSSIVVSPTDVPFTRFDNFYTYNPAAALEPISLEDCYQRISDWISIAPIDAPIITVFITATDDSSLLDTYSSYLVGTSSSLSSFSIITWPTIFGRTWITSQTAHIPLHAAWIPLARSYYALASSTTGTVHVLMPFRRKETNPWIDRRADPWTSYVYPTLTKNEGVREIVVVDVEKFERKRVIWRKGEIPFGRPPDLGFNFLTANNTDPKWLEHMISKMEVLPSVQEPTVFWSSLCPDGEACLDHSECLLRTFISTYFSGHAMHWFNLEEYIGTDPATVPSPLLSDYLRISPDSICYNEPGTTAVLESELATGTVYVILPKGADNEKPHEEVKKMCWWCACEIPVLTRNLKVESVVRIDSEDLDLSKGRVVWTRDDAPIGQSPYLT